MKGIFKGFCKVLAVLMKMIGWTLRPLVWILAVFSQVSNVGSQSHMSSQQSIENLAKYKSEDVKEKRNKQNYPDYKNI